MKIKKQNNTIEQALEALRQGKIIIVTDDEDRENEGDLIAAAEFCTSETINFMATHAKGLICLPMSKQIADRLNIDYMVKQNNDLHQTPFGISIDHIETTTGISTAERALTARKTADNNSKPQDFKRPGHMFPLIARPNGVLERDGHTEATVDLMKLANLSECGICCEIIKEDGTMFRKNDLYEFAQKWNLVYITIKQIQEYRKQKENLIELSSKTTLPTKHGIFDLYCFIDKTTKEHHLALAVGDLSKKEDVITRVHSECLTGDVFSSMKCDCGEQLEYALKTIQENQSGLLIYLRQEGRNIGLVNKLKAYSLQEKGLDTVEANLQLGFKADQRDYYVAAQIIKFFNINSINLLTNNPDKISKLDQYGININKRQPVIIQPNQYDEKYLITKKEKLGHLININKSKN